MDDPRVIDAMQNAGYILSDQPGIYRRDDGVQVDLLVPEPILACTAIAPPGWRAVLRGAGQPPARDRTGVGCRR